MTDRQYFVIFMAALLAVTALLVADSMIHENRTPVVETSATPTPTPIETLHRRMSEIGVSQDIDGLATAKCDLLDAQRARTGAVGYPTVERR